MGRGRPKKGSTSTSQLQSNQLAQQVTQIEEDERSIAKNLNPRFGEKSTATDEETTIQMEKKIDDEQRKLWVDVVNENRNPTKGMPLKYFAPQIVNGEVEVMIEDEDIESELKFWDTTLIMYVLGADMSMHSVKHFMMQNWNFVPLPDMYYHDEGYFLLRFSSHREREEVMMKGPYTIRNMSVLLREWRRDFNLKKDLLRTLPLWVKLPYLPLYLWGDNTLGKIVSAIGSPIVTDECTTSKLRVSYARILVEVDITKELPQEITIRDRSGNKLQQAIEFEWKP